MYTISTVLLKNKMTEIYFNSTNSNIFNSTKSEERIKKRTSYI